MNTDIWTSRWDERYSQSDYAYGEQPNDFFKTQIVQLSHGKLLLPAEGEGRNAVFAAKLGWDVSAFDISVEGRKKAMQLAEKQNVRFNYWIDDIDNLPFEKESFDAMALIYAHFPPSIKAVYHQKLITFLRKGAVVIFEAFSKKNLEYVARNEKIGGPRDIESLFSIEEISVDFADFEILLLEEVEITLTEGLYHNGQGSVIRFVGRKN